MALNSKFVENALFTVIFLIILYQVLADTSSDISASAGNLTNTYNASGVCDEGMNCGAEVLPLTSFFKRKGVVLLALMAGIVIVIVKSTMSGGK